MRRDNGVLIFLLAAVLVFGLALGVNQVWAQPEEEEEEPIQARPNPMERPADLSEPALLIKQKGDTSWDPFDKTGASGRAMKPGEEVMDDGEHGDGFISDDGQHGDGFISDDGQHGDGLIFNDGRRGMMQKGADGKMQLFLLQGGGKVLAPDGSYQLPDGQSITVGGGLASMPIDPLGKGGAMRPAEEVQIPGKMR